MEIKKSTKADLEGKRIYFFLIGLLFAVALLMVVLEWKYGASPENIALTEEIPPENFIRLDEEIEIVHQHYTVQAEASLPIPATSVQTTQHHYVEIFDVVANDKQDKLPEILSFEELQNEYEPGYSDYENVSLDYLSLDKSQPADSTESILYTKVEEMPEFPGGYQAFIHYLSRSIRYPQPAVVRQITGRVVCSFIIDKTGRIADVRIVESLDPHLDREALRVINNMPAWKPGRSRGKEVMVKFIVPLAFRL